MEIVVCWIVLLTWGLVKGEDFNINCNGDCNRTVANNTTCNVKWVESMPWSNHEKTAPSPTIVSGNWFLYNNGQSLEIGVNITWKQNAAVFNFVQGYLLTMTSLKSMAGRSSKWIFNASVSSQTINRYENLVFNYKCFHYGTKNFIRAGRTYVLDVYAMPVYEEQNEKVFDTIDIKIPDCNSNVEIAESTYCRDEQTDYLYLDFDENESDEVEVTTAAPKDSAPSKLLWLYIVIPLLMLIVTIITVSIYRHRRRKAIVAGSVVILCSRDSHYGEVTSRLATWLKEYMNRDVECNMWRQTDNNILDWCNKQLKEASQVILVCGEKDYEEQIVHSDPFVVAVNRMKSNVTNANFYMVAFHDETKSKFPL
uniref:SEFIR domain-containing protein n=2 Tax=Ciona intestinalis TaxID=7719 RepID=F6YHK9_CIOIN